MKTVSFLNATIVHTLRILALIICLSNINTANATSMLVNIEDMGLQNWDVIHKELLGFGSSGPVTLNWDPNNDFFTELIAYNSGYSGKGAAFCWYGEACALELLVSEENTSIVLESFFLGYFGEEGVVEYDVIDLETESSILYGSPKISGSSGSLISVDASSDVGFRILFGPDGFNGGINNIAYRYSSLGQGVTVVPIPAAVLLFGSGLLGLMSFSRQPTPNRTRELEAF